MIAFPQGSHAFRHPAVTLLRHYGLGTETPVDVNPYIVSILSLHSLHQGKHREDVREFIQWYFSRLNYPDKYGLTGTIYDHTVRGEAEESRGEYDSVDGYAGLFLTLLWTYTEKTGDPTFLKQHQSNIRDIAYLLAILLDPDGLTLALPKGRVKYFMNNCEAYGGIRAFNKILRLLDQTDNAYDLFEGTMRKGILRHFHDLQRDNFFWAISGEKKWESIWEKKYPDAFAQIFAIFYSLLEDHPGLEKHLWKRFTVAHGTTADAFPVEQRLMIQMARDRFLDRHKDF